MNLIEELRWRGLIHDMMPGTKEQLAKEATATYIGFDPTSDSLHIGSLVPIILLMHLKKYGHQPIALVGGATGMIGDPSGKSDERNLLDEATLAKNVAGIKNVLSKFLDFNSKAVNAPLLVNNYDWMKDFSFIDFARDVGKRITVNYMMSKESVKKRINGDNISGMSFTEFTYQLIQGYDFYHLNKHYNCKLQMGGSDQWGNITTGTELVRRMNEEGVKAFALTCPLITKSDGSKFGKSEGGNVWLDADKTSPYEFYQFWLRTSDEDAEKYIKIFTFKTQEEVNALITEHQKDPGLKVLQKALAEAVTILVHNESALKTAITASSILFGKPNVSDLENLSEEEMEAIFPGVPTFTIEKKVLDSDIDIVSFLVGETGILPSNGEAKRAIKENSLSINFAKVAADKSITKDDFLSNGYLLAQRGKKKKFLVQLV